MKDFSRKYMLVLTIRVLKWLKKYDMINFFISNIFYFKSGKILKSTELKEL